MAGWWTTGLAWGAAGLVTLWLLDRGALWAEDRGWIYWRKRQPDRATSGNAMLEVQALLEPQKVHVIEERRAEHVQQEQAGAKKRPLPRDRPIRVKKS